MRPEINLKKLGTNAAGLLGLTVILTTGAAAVANETNHSTNADAAPRITDTRRVVLAVGEDGSAHATIKLPGMTDVTCVLNAPLDVAHNNQQQVESTSTPPGPIVQSDVTIVNASTTGRTVELDAPMSAVGQKVQCVFSSDDVANTVQQHDPQSATRDAAVAYTQTQASALVPQPTQAGTELATTYIIPADQHNMVSAAYRVVYQDFAGVVPAGSTDPTK